MIQFNQVRFTYPDAEKIALHIGQLKIPAASFCLLSGQSGSGKSTLLRLVNGLVPHFSGGTISGEIWVNGLNPVLAGPQVMSQQVGFVFQEPENQFVVDVVEDEIVFSLENAAIPRTEMRRRLDQILAQLEIKHLRHRKVDSLSGGEAQRVAIAAALVLEPPILVLDEPTSQLDPFAAQEVLVLLDNLRKQNNLTILLAEQRLERVLPYANMMVHLLPDGQSCLAGTPRQVLHNSELVPPLVELAKERKWQPLPLTVADARQFLAGEVPPHCEKPLPKPEPSSLQESQLEPILQVIGLTISYQNQPALHDISFVVDPTDRLVIMGPNGAGKTTLLRSLVGLVKPSHGSVQVAGQQLQGATIFRQIGFLPQDPTALLFAESVYKELEITLRNHQQAVDSVMITGLLERLLLKEKSEAYPRDLSTGEKQRTALGAISITNPPILILDEPTRGLDQLAKQALLDLLLGWNKEGKTIVLVTHDVEFAAGFASRVIILENGRIVDDGDPREVMHTHSRYSPQIAQLFPDTGCLTVDDVIG